MSKYIKKSEIALAATFGIPSPADMKVKLANDWAWAQRGLLAVFARQKSDEQASKRTKHLNFFGFSKYDAEFLTSFAQQLEKKGSLSDKQMHWVFKKMPKYASQLFLISLENKQGDNE